MSYDDRDFVGNSQASGSGGFEDSHRYDGHPSPATPGTPTTAGQVTPASYDSPARSLRSALTTGSGYRGSPGSVRSRRSARSTSAHSATSSTRAEETTYGDVLEEDDDAIERHRDTTVWGTNIDVTAASSAFREFLDEFGADDEEADGIPYYTRRMQEIGDFSEKAVSAAEARKKWQLTAGMAEPQDVIDGDVKNQSLTIDASLLKKHPATEDLYQQLIAYPSEIINIMDMVANQVFEKVEPDGYMALHRSGQRLRVAVYNVGNHQPMRNLDPRDLDSLVCVRGMVTRVSGVLPEMAAAFFRCTKCNHSEMVPVENGHIEEPNVCTSCNSDKKPFELVHNQCLFRDRQVVKLQETPESIPEGETPHTITLHVYEHLVDVARPGDRAEITGVFVAAPRRVNPRMRRQHSVFATYLDVIHIRKSDNGRLDAEDDSAADGTYAPSFKDYAGPSDEAKRAKALAMRDECGNATTLYHKLARSLAPSIWELDDVKKGLLCQLFGGVNKVPDPEYGRCRGEINVLLCGDPGTSKSQLLSYVNKIAPRGIYTSGKGSSAVGLTAYVTKDPDTRELVLESGALVLSDRGICCIDEFDKMSDSTRSILHEVMEQQTVSIAKAGIICTLNARTAVLASANPVESRYNPNRSIVDNIQLPPTLLSRFDLIYLVLDKQNEDSDRRLATHLVRLYQKSYAEVDQDVFKLADLTDYVSYARANVHPDITEEAKAALIAGYQNMRSVGYSGTRKVITATTRQLESMIRLSEALARLELVEEVNEHHVQEAIRLMEVATQKAATDPTTGTIDMNRITTGRSASDGTELDRLMDVLPEVIRKLRYRSTMPKVLQELQTRRTDELDAGLVKQALEQLVEAGTLKISRRSGGGAVQWQIA